MFPNMSLILGYSHKFSIIESLQVKLYLRADVSVMNYRDLTGCYRYRDDLILINIFSKPCNGQIVGEGKKARTSRQGKIILHEKVNRVIDKQMGKNKKKKGAGKGKRFPQRTNQYSSFQGVACRPLGSTRSKLFPQLH